MIHVKNHRHPQGHADKARRIVIDHGGMAVFEGPTKHLRKIAELLADDERLTTFHGAARVERDEYDNIIRAEQPTTLVVSPADDAAWSAPRDRV